MGYTHYWQIKRAFTDAEWKLILGEAKRIIAKAARDYYTGKENAASQDNVTVDEQGFRHGFNEPGAWRTFPNPEAPIPRRGEPILLAGPDGCGKPRLTKHVISLNGKRPDDYESFVLEKGPRKSPWAVHCRRSAPQHRPAAATCLRSAGRPVSPAQKSGHGPPTMPARTSPRSCCTRCPAPEPYTRLFLMPTADHDRWSARFLPERYSLHVGPSTFSVSFQPVMFFESYNEEQLRALVDSSTWEVAFAEETVDLQLRPDRQKGCVPCPGFCRARGACLGTGKAT